MYEFSLQHEPRITHAIDVFAFAQQLTGRRKPVIASV